jgi:hypothetical protein
MLQLVVKIFSKLRPTSGALQFSLGRFRRTERTVTLIGTLVYFVDQRGYFAVVGDDGQKYYPFNSKQFPKVLRDRLRARFTLEYFPDVANVYHCGHSARLLAVEMLEE